MKVVYVKTILEKIEDAKREARENCKQIDYIELSINEGIEVCRILPIPDDISALHESTLFGVNIKVK